MGLVVAAGLSSAASAQELRTSVLVSGGASVESNPYNEINAGGENIALTTSIEPTARWRGELSTIDLSGLISLRQFTRTYGLESSYAANGSISTRASERLTVSSNVGFNSTQGGFNNFARRDLQLGAPTVEPVPGQALPDPVLIDPTILGRKTRTNAFNMGTGASFLVNTYSSLSLNVSGRALRFDGPRFGDFNNVTGQASYSHQLSEMTSIGATASVSRADYLRTPIGDSRTTSLQGTFDHRIGSNWTFNGSAGIAFTRIAQLPGFPDTKFDSLTAQVGFCRKAELSRVCLNASRSPEPSAEGNVRVTNVVQMDYSLRLSERENVTLSGSYAKTERGRGLVSAIPSVEFVSGAIRYDRQLRNNLTFYTAANASTIDSFGTSRRSNFGVNAGLQYRFGALQ